MIRAQLAAVVAALGTLLMAAGLVIVTGQAASATETNQADYWETAPGEQCVKVDDQGAESGGFTITDQPMDGYAYSKIIIKKGSGDSQGEENTVTEDPVRGETYFHASGSGYSHVILCQVPVEQPPGETTDVCPNLPDVQSEVPDGFHLSEGSCVQDEETPSEPVDVCANLDGPQTSVPEGYHAEGDACVKDETPSQPVDVCSNLEGTQESVPPGLEAHDGVCAAPQVKGTETIVPKPSTTKPAAQPTVLGTEASVPAGVPTVVDAGLATMPHQQADSSRTALAQGMVGGGLLLVIASGWLLLGRRSHGAHEA